MMVNQAFRRTGICAAAALLMVAGSATAAVTVSSPFLVIRATSALGSAQHVVVVPSGDVSETHTATTDWWNTDYAVGNPVIPLIDPGNSNVVASVNSYSESAFRLVDNAPPFIFGIELRFNVNAGAADTRFDVFSTVLTFDNSLSDPTGTASATLGGSDSNGDGIVIFPGGGAGNNDYLAMYNGNTVFRNYMGLIGPGAGSVGDAGNMVPPGSFAPIPGVVSDMSLLYSFTVSATDQAGGTTAYYIIPAPASLSLLGIGVLGASRRRRR